MSNIFIDCQIGSSYRQNWEIKEGIQGASSDNRLTIKLDSSFPVNASYHWTIAKNSAGEIKQYCEANELARATTSEIDALFA